MSALAELAAFARCTKNLREFLRHPLSVDEARRRVEEQLRLREESFLGVLEAGVFAQPASTGRS